MLSVAKRRKQSRKSARFFDSDEAQNRNDFRGVLLARERRAPKAAARRYFTARR
jgi:hypothetical protein